MDWPDAGWKAHSGNVQLNPGNAGPVGTVRWFSDVGAAPCAALVAHGATPTIQSRLEAGAPSPEIDWLLPDQKTLSVSPAVIVQLIGRRINGSSVSLFDRTRAVMTKSRSGALLN